MLSALPNGGWICLPRLCPQDSRKLLQSRLILLRETPDVRAVQVQHPHNSALHTDGNHDLRIGGTVAGDVSGELVDIPHELGLALGHGGSAYAPTHRNLNAGRLALEGAQHQNILFQQIKPRPVEAVQGVVQQCRGICQVGDTVGHAADQCLELGVQRLVVRHAPVTSRSSPWQPASTSRQVVSKSSVYHGSATSPGWPV